MAELTQQACTNVHHNELDCQTANLPLVEFCSPCIRFYYPMCDGRDGSLEEDSHE